MLAGAGGHSPISAAIMKAGTVHHPRANTTFLREPSKLFFTQVGKKRAGRLLDGVLHDAMPRPA